MRLFFIIFQWKTANAMMDLPRSHTLCQKNSCKFWRRKTKNSNKMERKINYIMSTCKSLFSTCKCKTRQINILLTVYKLRDRISVFFLRKSALRFFSSNDDIIDFICSSLNNYWFCHTYDIVKVLLINCCCYVVSVIFIHMYYDPSGLTVSLFMNLDFCKDLDILTLALVKKWNNIIIATILYVSFW